MWQTVWEKQQQEIRRGTASHPRFNNNIYIASLKWGHHRPDRMVNRTKLNEWAKKDGEKKRARARKNENEGTKQTVKQLSSVHDYLCVNLWLGVWFSVFMCMFPFELVWVLLCFHVDVALTVSCCLLAILSQVLLFETNYFSRLFCMLTCISLCMCGAASSSLIEKKEEELMEEQIYKAHNSKRRTEMKSETSGGMRVREQEVNQAKREGWGGFKLRDGKKWNRGR